MVGRAASIVSPWSILYSLVKTYFSLLFSYLAVLRFNLTSALEEEREYQSVNQLQFIHYFTVRYIFLRIISGSPSSFFKSNVLITIIVAFVLSRILWIDYTIQENVQTIDPEFLLDTLYYRAPSFSPNGSQTQSVIYPLSINYENQFLRIFPPKI